MGHCGGTEIGEVVDSKIAEESKGVINKDERGGGGKIARGRAQGAPHHNAHTVLEIFSFRGVLKVLGKFPAGQAVVCGFLEFFRLV
jgi:hypothetical protein